MRPTIIKRINKTLEDSGFYSDEFIVNPGKGHVSIRYIPTEGYRFRARYDIDEMFIEVMPGEISEYDRYPFRNASEFFDILKRWLRQIQDDKDASAEVRNVWENARAIREMVSKIDKIEADVEVNADELEAIKRIVEKLQEQLLEQSESNEAERAKMQERLDALEQTINSQSKNGILRQLAPLLSIFVRKAGTEAGRTLMENTTKMLSDGN